MMPSATRNATAVAIGGLAQRVDARLVQALEELVEAAAEDGGNREEEGVAGGRGALVAEEQTHRDRAARA